MGFFGAIKTLLSGGEIRFEQTTTVNSAQNLLTAALAVGEYETDDCVYFVWQRSKYAGRDCSEGEQ